MPAAATADGGMQEDRRFDLQPCIARGAAWMRERIEPGIELNTHLDR